MIKGNTRCNRGFHPQKGLNCTNYHGTLSDYTAGLLNTQKENRSSSQLVRTLQNTIAEANTRLPWIQEPDCPGCHRDFDQPKAGTSSLKKWVGGFSELYRIRTDMAELRCTACYNSPNSEYTAMPFAA